MPAEPTDRDLILETLRGDSRAFGTLVGRYLRPALAVAWEYGPALDDAEDLVQEAFHRALRNLRRFDTRKPFAPWLFTIVRNLGRNAAARDARWGGEAVPEDLASRSDPQREMENAEIGDRIEEGLAALPPMQRSCFRLCQVEGFESHEVAEMLGIGAATVRTHVHRARAALQDALSALREERNAR